MTNYTLFKLAPFRYSGTSLDRMRRYNCEKIFSTCVINKHDLTQSLRTYYVVLYIHVLRHISDSLTAFQVKYV